MVRFTIWSSHSPQTLLMLYRRMDEMISTAGFVTGKAKSFAVSSVPGFITLSVWDWHRNQRGTGFVLNVRLVPDEWMHYLPRCTSFLFLPFIVNSSNHPLFGPALAVPPALRLLEKTMALKNCFWFPLESLDHFGRSATFSDSSVMNRRLLRSHSSEVNLQISL